MTQAEQIYHKRGLDTHLYLWMSSKTKTAVIAAINEALNIGEFERKLQSDAIKAASTRITELEEDNKKLRTKEKNRINKAYNAGFSNGWLQSRNGKAKNTDGIDYYTKTFNNE